MASDDEARRERMKALHQAGSAVQYYVDIQMGMSRVKVIKDAIDAEQRQPGHDYQDGEALAEQVEKWLRWKRNQRLGYGWSVSTPTAAPSLSGTSRAT